MGAGAAVTAVAEVYDTGISFGLSGTASMVLGAILMAIFAPKIFAFGKKFGIYSIVDFFEKRFGKRAQILALILQLILLIVWTSVQIAAIGYLVNVITGLSYFSSLFIAMGFTTLYSTVGGLKIDIITDFLQFWVILIVFILMGIFGYMEIGSLSNLLTHLQASHFDVFAF